MYGVKKPRNPDENSQCNPANIEAGIYNICEHNITCRTAFLKPEDLKPLMVKLHEEF